ncbi:indole-3-glycerol phosphate synthase TrpC [Desulfobotulus sp. H1]|uniref:Indole-3-glycerol phosphate synthase n=1 Tax=Desulfobotulus pelophilus TaxID=2823377 RepID=A0ABT3N9K2_9BACT|nr:indole-3-glycerol phosphate synthase TrpC [Desulfobotulus pelophilus]
MVDNMTSILKKIIEKRKLRIEQAQRKQPEALLSDMLSQRSVIRDFGAGLHQNPEKPAAIMAEIKRRSPSKGDLNPDLDAASLAKAYENGGAVALSVLTEPDFFGGSIEDLKEARTATRLPVLRKDFIFHPYQVLESAVLGADAILLIARILEPKLHKELAALASELGLAVLHEIHGEEEIPQTLDAGARFVGINNRDLATFTTDIRMAPLMAALLPGGVIPVALSGIRGPEDIAVSRQLGVHSFLVGESLVLSHDPEKDLKAMVESGVLP